MGHVWKIHVSFFIERCAFIKLTNLDLITINDSLKAPLLKLNVIPTSNVVLPSTNELIIYVDKSLEETIADEMSIALYALYNIKKSCLVKMIIIFDKFLNKIETNF